MINIKEIELDNLKQYDNIEFKYTTNKIYELKKINKGLGGFLLEVKNVEIFTKEFKEKTTDWKQYFDLKKWKFLIAYDNDIPVGGAVLAVRREQIGGEEHSILWDIRVIEKYKHQGIGQMLFDKIKEEAKLLGDTEIKIECQNTNYPAINFYYKQGAILRCINDHAYIDYSNEVQMLWYLDL